MKGMVNKGILCNLERAHPIIKKIDKFVQKTKLMDIDRRRIEDDKPIYIYPKNISIKSFTDSGRLLRNNNNLLNILNKIPNLKKFVSLDEEKKSNIKSNIISPLSERKANKIKMPISQKTIENINKDKKE